MKESKRKKSAKDFYLSILSLFIESRRVNERSYTRPKFSNIDMELKLNAIDELKLSPLCRICRM